MHALIENNQNTCHYLNYLQQGCSYKPAYCEYTNERLTNRHPRAIKCSYILVLQMFLPKCSPEMVMDTLQVMRLQWECVDAANCAFRPVGCLAPRSRYSKITSLHRGSKSAVHGEKKSGCKGNERGSPSLDPNPPRSLLSLLPETASLSPTAAKTVKHHTASMIFTYSPGLQHGEPQDVTNPADGVKKRLKKSHK